MRRVLLIEPDFPIPAKSKNHKNFLPIGLLKIASFLRANNNKIILQRGKPKDVIEISKLKKFNPDEIWITSLFTYWAKYVKDAVENYRILFPQARILVGGIYASLMPEHCKEFTGCDEVFIGVIKEAEKYLPAYNLITNVNPHPIDYQIIHTSRGCMRECKFCGTWKIEPEFKAKSSIKDEIKYRKIIFYDNNLLANLYIINILEELIELKNKNKILWCESQSGFDGRKLLENPNLGNMLKSAGFRYPRIAWDWGFEKYKSIKKQLDVLVEGGYSAKEIFVFMLYNWDIPFEEMEKKRLKCWKWGIQIADCRYRPLNQTFDNYKPEIDDQTLEDYHIHEESGWTDELVKQFRKNVREQNICIRHDFPFYSKSFEQKRFSKEVRKEIKDIKNINKKIKYLTNIGASYWIPNKVRYPE